MARKTSQPKSTRRRTVAQSIKERYAKPTEDYSPEYREYLVRHKELGDDRPKLSPTEFDQLDDELLELLALVSSRLSDDQVVRLHELEYLLIDAE